MKILKEMNVVIMVSPNKKPSVRVVTDRRFEMCNGKDIIAQILQNLYFERKNKPWIFSSTAFIMTRFNTYFSFEWLYVSEVISLL